MQTCFIFTANSLLPNLLAGFHVLFLYILLLTVFPVFVVTFYFLSSFSQFSLSMFYFVASFSSLLSSFFFPSTSTAICSFLFTQHSFFYFPSPMIYLTYFTFLLFSSPLLFSPSSHFPSHCVSLHPFPSVSRSFVSLFCFLIPPDLLSLLHFLVDFLFPFSLMLLFCSVYPFSLHFSSFYLVCV